MGESRLQTHTYRHTHMHCYLAVQTRDSILWSLFSPAGLLQLAGDSCTNSTLPPALPPSPPPAHPPARHSFMTLNLSSLPLPPPGFTASITSLPSILSGAPFLIASRDSSCVLVINPAWAGGRAGEQAGIPGSPAGPTNEGLIKGGRVNSGAVLCHLRKSLFFVHERCSGSAARERCHPGTR